MKNQPKVSIITVVYNGIAHLEQTIESVVKQSYNNIEYIIIDGGSTDGTVELIQKYDECLAYWVSEPDGGIYDAMNKGISKATGEIVGLINADDWYEQGAISKIVDAFEKNGADIVHGSMVIYTEDRSHFIKKVHKNISHLNKGMLINHSTVFAKKSLYLEKGFFNCKYKIVADWEMMLRWWCHQDTFVGIDETIAHFRMGGVSSAHLKKSFNEKHSVRKEHGLYQFVDWYYIYDLLKSLFSGKLLIRISLFRQKNFGH